LTISIRPQLGERGGRESSIRHVELRSTERGDVVVASLGRQRDVMSQHSAGAGDEHAHQGTAISELSPTIKR
jgi:hypothetical protein